MDSLGTFFREAREAQGLSLQEVGASTRIQEFYLNALEEEKFNALPQKVFTKGFVRTYAKTLGLDEEEAVRRFTISAGSYYQKEEEEQQQVIQREEEHRKGKANRNAVIILTGVVLIGLIFILPREQSSPPPKSSSPPSKEIQKPPSESTIQPDGAIGKPEAGQDVAAGSSTTAMPSSIIEKPLTPAPQKPTESTSPGTPSVSETAPAVPATPVTQSEPPVKVMSAPFEPGMGEQDGPLMLELEALEITWVVVRSDNREPHEALLQPGERALWRAHDRFYLTLGNAGGVKVTLNGKPQGPFGKHGSVIRDLEVKP
jgi:cytoskeleton protein RodZ